MEENTLVTIGNADLQIREYCGQRVVTLNDIDLVHGRKSGTAGRNFRKNRDRFVEGTDFFELNAKEQPDEIRRLGFGRENGSIPDKVILITETGYLMLVKSLRDDLSWDVQRQIVNTYFKARQTAVSVAGNADMQTIMQGIERLIAQTNEENNRKITELENEIAELKSSKYVKLDFDLTPTWYDDNEERLFYLSEISGKPVKYFVHDILEFLAKFGFSKAKRWYIKNYGKPTYDLEILDCVPELSEAATCYIFELIRWEEVKAGIRGVKKYPTREEIEERERKWDEYFKS